MPTSESWRQNSKHLAKPPDLHSIDRPALPANLNWPGRNENVAPDQPFRLIETVLDQIDRLLRRVDLAQLLSQDNKALQTHALVAED